MKQINDLGKSQLGIVHLNQINFSKNGTYIIQIAGDLTMHGETNPVKATGELIIKPEVISASTEFYISLEQYKIRVEEQYKDRIKDEIKLTVHFDLKPM